MRCEYEFCRYIDKKEEADYMFGGSDFIITDEDIEALKSGKMINFSVNGEYGCVVKYVKEINDDQ